MGSSFIRVRLQLFAQERTEPPTPRRRQEARRKGQVAKTPELSSALILLAVFSAAFFLAGSVGEQVSHFTRLTYEHHLINPAALEAGQVHRMLTEMTVVVARIVAPLLAVAAGIGLFAQVAQIGFLIAVDPLKPQLKRINPLSGFKRIFSKRSLIELAKSTLKIVIVGYIAYGVVKGSIQTILTFAQMPPEHVVAITGRLVFQVGLWVAVALIALAALDYMYQRWEFEQSIRMSKQEVREELRQTEGDPQIRSKMRQRQRQIANMRMMAQVPTADVVITNPVHIAVALQYDERTMDAPMVVAKGAGPLAARIKETARDHGVSVVENVWLARSLYESADINTRIPEELYQAVAEVLAFVYRMRQAGATR